MHVRFDLFFRAMWETLASRPVRLGKLAEVAAWCIAFPPFELFTWLCLQMDHFVFPSLRKTTVSPPVFIIGNPRSGTSLFFRLLALDEETFFCFRLHEIVFPAMTQQYLIRCLARADRALGAPLKRLWERLENRLAASTDYIRRARLSEPEEDDLLHVHQFACVSLLMLFPRAAVLHPLIRYDELDPSVRRPMEIFYMSCLQRRQTNDARGRRLLSKNVTFAAKVHSISQLWENAKFIHLVRNPSVSIASMMDMFDRSWTGRLTQGERAAEARTVLEAACHLYQHAMAELARLPETSWCTVEYERLIEDPVGTIEGVYELLGLSMRPGFGVRLERAVASSRAFRSSHEYSLAQFGVTEAEIRATLARVYERFAFKETVENRNCLLSATPPPKV
jgi:hypothetical protein